MRRRAILAAFLLFASPAAAIPTSGLVAYSVWSPTRSGRLLGLVAYWLGEGNALDSWGHWDMVAVNGASYAPGVSGLAFSFDGVDDYVTLGPVTTSPFRQDTGISYAFWANIALGGGGYAIGAEGATGHGYGGVAYDLVDGSFGLDWSPTDPIGDTSHSGTFSFTPGAWHHVVVTADFATSSIALYLDGEPVPVDFQSNDPDDATPYSPYTPAGGEDTVGARIRDDVVTSPFEGLIDEVLLYDRALTPGEAAQIFSELSPTPEPGTAPLLLAGLAATAGARRRRLRGRE